MPSPNYRFVVMSITERMKFMCCFSWMPKMQHQFCPPVNSFLWATLTTCDLSHESQHAWKNLYANRRTHSKDNRACSSGCTAEQQVTQCFLGFLEQIKGPAYNEDWKADWLTAATTHSLDTLVFMDNVAVCLGALGQRWAGGSSLVPSTPCALCASWCLKYSSGTGQTADHTWQE